MKPNIWNYVKQIFIWEEKNYLLYAMIGAFVLVLAVLCWIVYQAVMKVIG